MLQSQLGALVLGAFTVTTYPTLWVNPSPVGVPVQSPNSSQIISQTSNLASLEQAVHTQINQYRASKRLPALTLDPRISEQARVHSQAMANKRVAFGHQGFEQRVQTLGRSISYQGAAENVAYNQGYSDPATQAVKGWIKSPGHRTNIEGQYNRTGIGIARNAKGEYYFTQIFIRSR